MYPLRLFVLYATLRDGNAHYQFSTLFRQGYDAAFFNFYAPFTYLFAELFHLVGFSLTGAIKAVIVTMTL